MENNLSQLKNDLFLRACKRQNVERTPIWIMRQAGRYLPEYRAVRAKSDFLTMCKTPELAAEVTIQPVDIVGVDAAILFSDILVIPEAMGMHLEMNEGKGPVFPNPIRTVDDAKNLKDIDPTKELKYVLDAVALTKKNLDNRVPLIGFSGSPWTLLTYMVEGKGSKNFSEVKKLTDYEKSEFIPTLEHEISDKKNFIYCVTLLYAWDEIRKEINQPLEIPNEYIDLTLLNQSNSYANVLKNNEYKASGGVDGGKISARAEFNKSLPLEIKLQNYHNKLVFDNQKVASFGVNGSDNSEQLQIVNIVYYKNDNDFIIKLLPKDKNHEILLFKSEKPFNTISEMNREIERLSKIGQTEKTNEKLNWKYYYAIEDEVVIPKFNFNIETNYSTLEGKYFKTKNQNFQIETAWQRTAFILDESGAKVESEAGIEVAAEIMDEEYERPKPKKMIFDKPFLILLKRIDAKNPYFGLWTTNTELMIKE